MTIFIESGLRHRTCKHPGHASEPTTNADTAAHFSLLGNGIRCFSSPQTCCATSSQWNLTTQAPQPFLSLWSAQVEGHYTSPRDLVIFFLRNHKTCPTIILYEYWILRVFLVFTSTFPDSGIKSKGIALTWLSSLIMIASHIDREGKLLDTLELILSYKRFKRIPLGWFKTGRL